MSQAGPSNLTEEAVEAALRSDRGSEAKLLSWTRESFTSRFDGATSVVEGVRARFSLRGREGEASFVAKTMPPRSGREADFFALLHAKECLFYSQVAPALDALLRGVGQRPLALPRCLHFALERGREAILLEDLREEGYAMADKALGVDAAHALLVLRELARLHAASWLLRSRDPEKGLAERFDALRREWSREFGLGPGFGAFVGARLDVGAEMLRRMGGCDRLARWVEGVKPRASRLYEAQLERKPPFAVVTHADCWINNLMFRYDGGGSPVGVKLLDLQCCREASLATDLQHFLNLNVAGQTRRRNLDGFLSSYHDAFGEVVRAGGSSAPFTLQELRREYVDKGFYGVLNSIMWLPNMVRRPEDATDVLDMREDGMRAEKESVLRMVDTNPLLRPRILSVMEEWEEMGVIS